MECRKVSYHNDLYQLRFVEKLKEKELDLFFTIVSKIKNLELSKTSISFLELRKSYSNGKTVRKTSELIKDLKTLSQKILQFQIEFKDSKGFGGMVLFPDYYINVQDEVFLIGVHQELKYLFNHLQSHFTILDLVEYQSLTSKYSKNLYYLLKQYSNIAESQRIVKFPIDEFREKLGIPDSYRMDTIDSRVIQPSLKELLKFFPNIKIEKIKRGVSVSELHITWKNKIKVITEKTIKEPIENIIPVETTGTKKADKIINSVLEDKNNSVTKEHLQSVELTLEQIARAEYLLEQVDKVNLSFVRKFPSYKSMLKQRLQQEENQNKTN